MALKEISALEGIRVLKRSSLYRTEPVGVKGQDWFVNAVLEIRTAREAHSLLKELLGIERAMGRVRGSRWAPRIIDIDLLLYAQEVVEDGFLLIPHPEMHKRRFVLEPLAEIASYVIHPLFGVSVRGLLERLDDQSAVELLSGVPF
jgi:2-amino-4-hydroxy-6-hydroxymethyldihydropteridine diphosphokinase